MTAHTATVTVTELPGFAGWTFTVTACRQHRDHGLPRLLAVSVEAPQTPGECVGIDAPTWRKVPTSLLARAAAEHLERDWVDLLRQTYGITPRVRQRLDAEHLTTVVAVYRERLEAGSETPNKDIGVVYGAPTTTVDRWVKAARDSGLLGELRHEQARADFTSDHATGEPT